MAAAAAAAGCARPAARAAAVCAARRALHQCPSAAILGASRTLTTNVSGPVLLPSHYNPLATTRAGCRHSSSAVPSQDSGDQVGTLFDPTEEHRALRQLVQSFVAQEVEPQALEYNRAEKFNHPLFQRAGELGLLGVTVNEQYGGAGMDATAACIVHEELSYSDPAFCLSYLAHSQLFVNNLARNGSLEQCKKWLPAACSGEMIGGMGMSEPAAGTDVLGMKSTAARQADGSYVLNGAKMWITNGAVSDSQLGDAFLVYARTAGPEVKPSQAVSLFLVEKGMPGFALGQRLKDKCGMRASPTAELVFDNVAVPAENLVGKEGGATVGDARAPMRMHTACVRRTCANARTRPRSPAPTRTQRRRRTSHRGGHAVTRTPTYTWVRTLAARIDTVFPL
uniref:Isovaleryl-CoA dehydrogenase n=1 Tax=Chrysotila carterae TaxID=13221 RepID=A0A7S4BBN7_CHRCT